MPRASGLWLKSGSVSGGGHTLKVHCTEWGLARMQRREQGPSTLQWKRLQERINFNTEA